MAITQKDVLENFYYKDGNLYWKIKNGVRGIIGRLAGSKKRDTGYFKIQFRGKQYFVSRLVFLYHNGFLPKYVDHKDRDKDNNRIENLREVTSQQNNRNRTSTKNSTSKYIGVWIEKNKWRSGITVDGKPKYLGVFDNEKDAAIAFNNAAKVFYGEFANLNVVD